MTVALEIAVAAATHPGRVRHANQDAWSYSVPGGLFVVCDGMGGAAGGEIASRLAVDAFLEHLSVIPEQKRTTKSIAQAVSAANRRVHARAVHTPALAGMGTTLVALVRMGGQRMGLVHVGDSRAYRWHSGVLEQLTEDHSLVAEQIRGGLLTQEDAELSPMRNVITRAVGTRRTVQAEVQTLTIQPGSIFLLCSDGLSRELRSSAIAVLLGRQESIEQRNESLIDAALRAGGRDNVTSMLVEVG